MNECSFPLPYVRIYPSCPHGERGWVSSISFKSPALRLAQTITKTCRKLAFDFNFILVLLVFSGRFYRMSVAGETRYEEDEEDALDALGDQISQNIRDMKANFTSSKCS